MILLSILKDSLKSINDELNSLCKTPKVKKKSVSENQKKENINIITKLVSDSSKNIFERKKFKIGNNIIEKSDIYNFFDSKFEINSRNEFVEFTCKVCDTICSEKFKLSSNLTSHLKSHNTQKDYTLKEYFENKQKSSNFASRFILVSKKLKLF